MVVSGTNLRRSSTIATLSTAHYYILANGKLFLSLQRKTVWLIIQSIIKLIQIPRYILFIAIKMQIIITSIPFNISLPYIFYHHNSMKYYQELERNLVVYRNYIQFQCNRTESSCTVMFDGDFRHLLNFTTVPQSLQQCHYHYPKLRKYSYCTSIHIYVKKKLQSCRPLLVTLLETD